MVAFITSVVITLAMTVGIAVYARFRKPGTPLSWGEAALAATYVFTLLFLAYGVVPHQWLMLADNDLKWRSDKLVFGPGDILKPEASGGNLPLTITYLTVRDIIVSGIYGVFLAGHVAMWAVWQGRGKKKESAVVPASTFGRPLVKRG